MERLTPGEIQLLEDNYKLFYKALNRWQIRLSTYDKDEVYGVILESYIRSAKAFDKSKGHEFSTLFFTVAKNRALKLVRKYNAKKRQGIVYSYNKTIFSEEDMTFEDILGSNDKHSFIEEEWVRDSMDNLKPKERIAVQMNVLEGISQKEIGKVLGVTQVHAGRLVKKGLDKIKEDIIVKEMI